MSGSARSPSRGIRPRLMKAQKAETELFMTDNNEATAWNGVLGGGTSAQPPANACGANGLSGKQTVGLIVGATMAGFFTGVTANRKPGPK